MRCADVRTRFSQLSLPLPGELPVELQAATEHLEECDDCRLAWEAQAAIDAQLARQMQAVAVPADCRARLQQGIATNRIATEPRRRPVRRRSWPWIAAALMLLLTAGLGAWQVSSATATVDVQRLLVAIDRSPTSSATASRRERPQGWPADSSLVESAPQRLDFKIPVCAVPFQYRAPRSNSPASGTLWIVDAKRIADASSLPSFEEAQTRYDPHNSRLIWRENEVVYILEMEDLRPLKERMRKSRSLA